MPPEPKFSERIRDLAAQQLPAKEIAKQVGCDLTWVYRVLGARNRQAIIRRQIAELQADVANILQRLQRVERLLLRKP